MTDPGTVQHSPLPDHLTGQWVDPDGQPVTIHYRGCQTCDCTCGWTSSAWPGRELARAQWERHKP